MATAERLLMLLLWESGKDSIDVVGLPGKFRLNSTIKHGQGSSKIEAVQSFVEELLNSGITMGVIEGNANLDIVFHITPENITTALEKTIKKFRGGSTKQNSDCAEK